MKAPPKVTSRRRKGLLVLVGVCAGAVFGPPGIAAAKDAITEVLITNTSDHPVPVAGTVNVGNLPASQEVTGTVSVANAIDHAPAQPFGVEEFLSYQGSPGDFMVLLTVPEGKTAVIETASAWMQADPNWVPLIRIFDDESSHFVALTQQATTFRESGFGDEERTQYVGTETIRLSASAGSRVWASLVLPLHLQGDPIPSVFGRVSITGYFVDTPASGGA